MSWIPPWSKPGGRSAITICVPVGQVFWVVAASCAIRRAFITVRERTTDVLNGISLAQGARWELRTASDAEPEWESIANWQI